MLRKAFVLAVGALAAYGALVIGDAWWKRDQLDPRR